MIERYSRPEMSELFSERSRWKYALRVERAACEEMVKRGWVPRSEASKLISGLKRLEAQGGVDFRQVQKIEAQVQHDVIAFVTVAASKLGKPGRWLHFGLTSSDVLDTALSLQLQEARKILLGSLDQLDLNLSQRAQETASLPCIGRTHGMHAEPTIFGLKFLSFREEFRRHRDRLERAFEGLRFGKISGAVGSYGHLDPAYEKATLNRLGLKVEPVSTQIIPRDRHAELYSALALLGGGMERVSTEIRSLQRSEVNELREGFAKSQKGSSAMPHKRNPIASENLCGVARLLRGYALSGFESTALWHERDISHSSVERVALVDALVLADYAVARLARVISQLEVDRERIAKNLEAAGAKIYSGKILLELVRRGANRDDAYRWVQECSHEADGAADDFVRELEYHKKIGDFLKKGELKKIFYPTYATRHVAQVFKRVGLSLKR